MIATDHANQGFCLTSPGEGNWVAVIDVLQQVESDTMEATSTSQSHLINCLNYAETSHLIHCLNFAETSSRKLKRQKTLDSPYFQQLKHFKYSLDTLQDYRPAVFEWIFQVQLEFVKLSTEAIRSTLQILLGLGADMYARCFGYTPLHYLFRLDRLLDKNAEPYRNTIEIATALLENGADLFALDDEGDSVFDAAEFGGKTSELSLALQRAGYDIDEVRYKMYLAQWAFRNPGHGFAESTALDRAQIEPPSTAGLVSRRVVHGDRLEE